MCDTCRKHPCKSTCPNAQGNYIYSCHSCGEGIYEGELYFQLGDCYFHTACIYDGYSIAEVLSLLKINAKIAKNSLTDVSYFSTKVILGRHKNVVVDKEWYSFFKKRFCFSKRLIDIFSRYKHTKGISIFDSDQALLERWALRMEEKNKNIY